jgi:hypothetical protein
VHAHTNVHIYIMHTYGCTFANICGVYSYCVHAICKT